MKTFFIDSWDGLDAHEGVTVRSVEGARAFLWEDEPDATYRAIHAFVEGLGSPPIPPPTPAPAA